MFHRKRATSNPPRHNVTTPASSAALLGATRAFVKPSASNGGLSSAAAAAALRTHPSAPVQVGNIQTKRMVRRGSTSSNGSAPGSQGQQRQTLQRQNSSGSMSERSFRAASPNNVPGAPNGLDLRAPPVPAIPQNLAGQSRKRASSVEPPYRVGSPQQRGRGVSVDRGVGTPSPVNRPSQLASVPEREDSRRSINFSRPMSPPLSPSMSPRTTSPVPQKGHSGWFTTPVTPESRTSGLRNELPPLQSKVNQSPIALENVQQDIRNAANKPVSKKTHATAVEGAYLSKGGMPAKPTGTAVQSDQISSPVNRQAASQSNSSELSPIGLTTKPIPHNAIAPTNLTEGVNRTASVSPARSARFADGGLALPIDIMHQPPPRSLSPAKSAMKRSATSPGRTSSPRFSSAVSDQSDTVSDDGSRSGTGKKKKNVRVSFDEGVVDSRPESPSIAPARGLAASRWSNQTLVEDDMDEIMKPRPALPSFDSLRGRKPRDDGDMPEKVTETVNLSMTSSISTIAEPLHTSNDHALANVVTHDFAKKQQEKNARFEPIPPEVTSVEGSGYISDSDASFVDNTNGTAKQVVEAEKEASPIVAPVISVQPPTPKVEQEEEELFAIPGGWDDDGAGKTGFTAKDASATPATTSKSAAQDTVSTTTIPTSVQPQAPSQRQDIAKKENHGYADLDGQSSDDLDSALHTLEEESESDGSSIYSDAEEEHSDGGGFASLDAIVESPIVSTPPKLPKLAVETSPLAAKAPSKPVESPREVQSEAARTQGPNEDWNEAKQYWSGLSDDRRKEVEREEAVRTAQASASSPISPEVKPKKKKAVQPAPQSSPVASPVASPQQNRQTRPTQQPIKPALKKTMCAPPEPEPVSTRAPIQQRSSMRQSMRGPPPGPEPAATHMRTSMRDGGGATLRSPIKQGGLAASKYSDASEPRGALQKRNIPMNPVTSVAPPARPRSTIGIAASKYATPTPAKSRQTTVDPNDSDASESSFRRSRPRNREGGMTMRRSMRAQPTAPMPSSRRPASAYTPSLRPMSPDNAPPKSSRLSVRSLSPTGSMFRSNFRSGSIDGGAPTMRKQVRPTSRGSIFSFGKKDKVRPISSSSAMAAPRMAAPRAPPPARRFKSRFADSSDEEDDDVPTAQPTFRSRFADSDSDEDVPPLPLPMPKDLTPVRGIPRKAGDDDRSSTDLDDERDELDKFEIPPAASSSKPTTTTQGSALAAGSIRDSKHARIADSVPDPSPAPKEKKKRTFFGLGRKKAASHTALPAIAPLSNNRPSTPTRSATASPAPQSPGGPPTRSPKLQRRITPQRVMSDSWPLPAPPPTPGLEERPMSSDGYLVNGGGARAQARPGLGKRMSSQGTAATAPVGISGAGAREREVVLGRTGKKKKFPGLRRMFWLHD